MSHGDGPPSMFDGDDFPYWKIRMEAYLEAIDVGVLRAATQGYPQPKDDTNLTDDETNHVKWNAKAKNTLFRGICKDVFNRVRNNKDAHDLWTDICALHEGTKSEREECYHLVMKKLNAFEMLTNENANEMYSRLNVLVEEVNGLGLTQIQPSDVVRRILGVLPIDKYGHIVMVLHQGDLSTSTPTQILGKINAHKMYMHITPQDGSSSDKKKDLAFKASQEKKEKAIVNEVILASSSDDDDSNIALMPKKDKYKKKYKDNKDDSSDEDDKYKKKNKPYNKRDGKKKEYHKKKNGKAYIVGDWLTDLDTLSGSSGEDSDDEKEKVAAIVIGSSPSTPPPSPSSSTHLCLMGKGDRKVQSEDESSGNESGDGSDSDDEFEAPTYDELVKLLNKYSKIIMKTRDKNEKLNLENDSLLAKYDIAEKVSVELRDENKVVLSTVKELKTSLKELKEKYDKLERIHKELNTRHNLLKDEYTNLKINHENLVLSHELLSIEPHDATNNIVKIDIATSCDDLIDESIEQGSSSKGKQVVVANQNDDYVKLKNENEKLNEENQATQEIEGASLHRIAQVHKRP
ncbi:spindle pole body component 110-like [Miscanthus floridulus]|uniref:spindle pole body component 110-like n=1 Tax=Miscanthus floridulus TaxID=154761 RepID=UPI003459852D